MGVPSPGFWNAREFPAPANINRRELSQRSPSQLQDLVPLNCLQAPMLNVPHETTSKTGSRTHPSADRLPKVVISPETPQNTRPEVALPIRGKRSSSTHQNTGTSPPTKKPTQVIGPTSPTGGRQQKQEGLPPSSLQKRDLKHIGQTK